MCGPHLLVPGWKGAEESWAAAGAALCREGSFPAGPSPKGRQQEPVTTRFAGWPQPWEPASSRSLQRRVRVPMRGWAWWVQPGGCQLGGVVENAPSHLRPVWGDREMEREASRARSGGTLCSDMEGSEPGHWCDSCLPYFCPVQSYSKAGMRQCVEGAQHSAWLVLRAL